MTEPNIAKRLLVASMACVAVWAIAADTSPEGVELQEFLIKLSGWLYMKCRSIADNPQEIGGNNYSDTEECGGCHESDPERPAQWA